MIPSHRTRCRSIGPRVINFLALTSFCAFALGFLPQTLRAQPSSTRERVIIDTDIGIDIDDALAVALAMRTPEIEVLGFTTASGDTLARSKILDRMLGESGYENIPVATGVSTISPDPSLPSNLMRLQKRYGDKGRYVRPFHRNAIELMLEQINRFPGEVTLVAVGPLTNVGVLIERDPETFKRLKRVVIMGGWFKSVEDKTGQKLDPRPEYNIRIDIRAAQKLFSSGVATYVMSLDSTAQLTLDEVKRHRLFTASTPLTDSLALLYLLWEGVTPVLHDAMAIGFVTNPELCPVEPIQVIVDDKGNTRAGTGRPNAQVCMHSDANLFMNYFLSRLQDRSSEAE